MDITGIIKQIGQTQTVGQSFTKRELIIETQGQYPQPILIEFYKDKTSLLDGLKIGTEATVHFNLQGRAWTSPQGDVRHFNTLVG
jgi:hypothetical protein